MRHRIAVVVPGGVGKDQNIPSLVQLLYRLSVAHVLYLYSFSPGELHPLLARQEVIYCVPPKWSQRMKIFSVIYFFFKLHKDQWAHSFSLLHCFWISPAGLTALAVNVFLRLPIVLSLPGGDTVHIPSIQYGSMKSQLHRLLIRWCCRRADYVVLLTQYQEAIALKNGIHPQNTRIIPFGVDTSQFTYQPKQLSAPLQLISIGSINRVKDVFMQIKTFTLLLQQMDCHFMIVGPDILNGKAYEFAKSLNVAHMIQWKGQCSHSEIPYLLHESHLLLHTAWYEAEGVVIREAFSAGTVVVGTRVGLLAEIDPTKECTVDTHNPDHLTKIILNIIRDPKLYKQLQETNRQYAEQCTIDWTAAEYKKLYRELFRKESGNNG
jgi:glycosyltransferase involved in cell wall biosynthesis